MPFLNINYFTLHNNFFCGLINSYFKVISILSYIYRFLNNCMSKEKIAHSLSKQEFDYARIKLIKLILVTYFSSDIKSLKKCEQPNDSYVTNLNPFLYNDDI